MDHLIETVVKGNLCIQSWPYNVVYRLTEGVTERELFQRIRPIHAMDRLVEGDTKS